MKIKIIALITALFVTWIPTASIYAEEVPYEQKIISYDGISYITTSPTEVETGFQPFPRDNLPEILVIPPAIRDSEGNEYQVTAIGQGSFSNCTNIKELELPDTVKIVKANAFRSHNLNKINMGNGVEIVEDLAFAFRVNNSTYMEISFGNNLKEVRANAFDNAYIKSVVLPDSVEVIGTKAFRGVGAETVQLSKNLKRLDSQSFVNNPDVSEITIHEKIEHIDSLIFSGCSNLKKITIHKPTIPQLMGRPFQGLSSDTIVYVPNGSIGTGVGQWNPKSESFVYDVSILPIPFSIPIPESKPEKSPEPEPVPPSFDKDEEKEDVTLIIKDVTDIKKNQLVKRNSDISTGKKEIVKRYTATLYSKGVEVLPTGEIQVELALGDTLKSYPDVEVVRIENDIVTEIIVADITPLTAKFTTDRLGEFGVLGNKEVVTPSPQTGDTDIVKYCLAISLILLATSIYMFRYKAVETRK